LDGAFINIRKMESMIWIGSSAGVALTNKFPDARNVTLWLRKGWHVTLAFILGFFFLYII